MHEYTPASKTGLILPFYSRSVHKIRSLLQWESVQLVLSVSHVTELVRFVR